MPAEHPLGHQIGTFAHVAKRVWVQRDNAGRTVARHVTTKKPTADDLALFTPEQVSFCTCSADCAADVDAHDENCPVEAELRRDFGF